MLNLFKPCIHDNQLSPTADGERFFDAASSPSTTTNQAPSSTAIVAVSDKTRNGPGHPGWNPIQGIFDIIGIMIFRGPWGFIFNRQNKDRREQSKPESTEAQINESVDKAATSSSTPAVPLVKTPGPSKSARKKARQLTNKKKKKGKSASNKENGPSVYRRAGAPNSEENSIASTSLLPPKTPTTSKKKMMKHIYKYNSKRGASGSSSTATTPYRKTSKASSNYYKTPTATSKKARRSAMVGTPELRQALASVN